MSNIFTGLGWTGLTHEKRNEQRNDRVDIVTLSAQSIQNFRAMQLSAVFRAVEIISDSLAILPIQVKIKGKDHDDVFEDHPFKYIFKQSGITKFNFIKLLIQDVLLKGAGFAYIERGEDGTAIGLKYLDANTVQIFTDKTQTKILYYTCDKIGEKKIEPCNMIHLIKNSYDGIHGKSVISFASQTLELSKYTEKTAKEYFTSGKNLAGILKINGNVDDDKRNKIREQWNTAYNENGSNLAILSGNMEYQPIQLNAADVQMLESRKYNIQDIARFFGLSPVLLGDLSHSSFSTLEAVQQMFVLHSLQSYIIMIEEEFSFKLFKPSESNLFINLDETAILKTDKNATANYYSSLLKQGVLCINEVRKELGYAPIEDGDKHFVAYTKIEDNVINK